MYSFVSSSLTVVCRVTVHKAASLPPIVQNLNYPLIENANECKCAALLL